MLVTVDDPALTQHYHTKSIVYIGFTLGVIHSIQSSFTALKPAMLSLFIARPPPSPWLPVICLMTPQFLPFPECLVVGIIQYVAFSY